MPLSKSRITEMEITWRVFSGEGAGGDGGRGTGNNSINGRYKINRGRLRIVWGMEKPRNLYVQPMDIN